MTRPPIPLTMPEELLEEVESAASETGLSKQEIMCQSIELGLPKLRKHPPSERGLSPFTQAESRAAFSPDPEWERLEAAMARRSVPKPGHD
ncbi:MAG: hypothetical protein HYY24_01745 [Verrucomicrobia bacterium]|nr:hypothetical protein [Verrucomicrobiota bacterium]